MAHEAAATGGRSIVIRIAAVTIGAAIVAELIGLAGWRLYDRWRSGRVVLTNQGPALTVQVLDESGEIPVGEPFDLVAESVLTLPDGDYRLRVNGEGRLGRTYRFAVNRGETVAHELSLDEGLLLGGERWRRPGDRERKTDERRPFAPITAALELTPGKSDLIEYDGRTIIRRDGRTGRPVWDLSQPSGPDGPLREPDARIRAIPVDPEQVSLVDPPPDLDGDGVNDLVWLFHDHPTLLAVSGKDGSVLWSHSEAPQGPGAFLRNPADSGQAAGSSGSGSSGSAMKWGCVVRTPAVADVDRDGVPDLVATLYRADDPAAVAGEVLDDVRSGRTSRINVLYRRVVVAVSGRTGRPLWTNPVDITYQSATSPGRAAALVSGRRSPLIAYVDDTKWFGLDPATGRRKAGPIDLGFQPVRAVQHADLDGDGEPEVVALGPGPIKGQQSLVAIACSTGRTLWTQTVPAPSPSWAADALPLDQPWLLDLDGDGRTEVIVPDQGTMPPASGYQGVRVLDGATGQTRWARPICRQNDDNDGLARLAEAPDLDGDGVRDLIAVSVFQSWTSGSGGPKRAFVDALSGKDGHPLWSWTRGLPPGNRYVRTGPVRWWGRGPDGWPLLAIPLGGDRPHGGRSSYAESHRLRPIVHVLESSTGREQHTAQGFYRPEAADLDGDGLLDLWGEADGQLRAFCGQSPEVWRALGDFKPADAAPPFRPPGDPESNVFNLEDLLPPADDVMRPRGGSDLDGDGVGDALIERVHPPGAGVDRMTGSRTAIARSGRDGRVIWKTRLGSSWHGLDRDSGDSYTFTTSPPPDGDLDGDGTADVLVTRGPEGFNLWSEFEPSATLPVRALSGRAGRPLWAAGLLPGGSPSGTAEEIDVDDRPVIARLEPDGRPDVVVLYGRRSGPANSPLIAAMAQKQQRLARLSGRDGRVVWDIGLKEFDGPMAGSAAMVALLDIPLIHLGDLDGDGSLDAVYINTPARFTTLSLGSSMQDIELQAVSLKRGERLWSHRFPLAVTGRHQLLLAIGDLDGDRRSEVIVANAMEGRAQALSQLNALDGPDGRVLWTWTGVTRKVHGREDSVGFCLVGVGRGSRQVPCLMVSESPESRRLVMLDARGHETARRDLPPDDRSDLRAADLDGDGNDELLLASKEGVQVFRADLQEAWSRRPLAEPEDLRHFPATSGRPGAVTLPPALGLDGTDGHPLWSGQPGPPGHGLPRLLDWDGPGHRPLWMVGAPGASVCRSALPVTPAGGYAPPRGTPVPPGLARDDPRWARPLPWIEPIRRALDPPIPLIAVGLALVNVALPIGIIRLAARRRPWGLRLLMALPVAAAIPLAMFPAFGPAIPARIGWDSASARLVFVLATLAGLPILAYAGTFFANLVRRRGKPLVRLVGLTILASAIAAAAWLSVDLRNMPAIEHYDRSNWSLVIIPGAYAAGILLVLARPARPVVRRLRRSRNRPAPALD